MVTSKTQRLPDLREILSRRETSILSAYATTSDQAVRRVKDSRLNSDYRTAFSLDTDRILYSRAYTRYIDKTQVFYLVANDHITHRVLHVQLVSKIARTIGRCLGLNEDLIEAIALGHDIGHTPFGHDGERFLSKLCQVNGIGAFYHNVQSIQLLDCVEQYGQGWNLSLQTLDGILCHDGEIHDQRLVPESKKTFKELDSQVQAKKTETARRLTPMTLEGCAMRMADTISYIGRDIEDAIRLKLIRRKDLPPQSVKILGDSNGTIVYRLVTDLIAHSWEKKWIAFSPEVSQALAKLKKFNYQRIYLNPILKAQKKTIQNLFGILFEEYLEDIQRDKRSSAIFTEFLEGMSPGYIERHTAAEVVRDFISGMTDRYFLRQCPKNLRPKPLSI